ncbi:hypothetical protein N8000_07330 [Rhodospirillales bacterium]|nr:hypothetical protein [Rhodospirillales bacterium]
MATQNNTTNAVKDGYTVENVSSTFTFSGESAGEVIQMYTAKKGEKVLDASVYTAALGSGVQLEIGDGDDPNGYVTATTANTAGLFRMNGALGAGKEYSADDTVDITTSGGAATGAVTLNLSIKRTFD